MKILDFNKRIPLEETCLIEASAGTGKTYSITNIFLYAILAKIPIERILVVTYTEAATKELKSRIRGNLTSAMAYNNGEKVDENLKKTFSEIFAQHGSLAKKEREDLLETAILNIDQSSIFTVHGFCQRMLTENAFESKIAFGAELITDPAAIILEMAENFWRSNLLNVPEAEKELYSQLKFETFHDFAKDVVKYHNVTVVNDKYEPPQELEELNLRDLQDEYDKLLEKIEQIPVPGDFDQLKSETLNIFKGLEKHCVKAYSGDQLLSKINNALTSVRSRNSVNGLTHFTYGKQGSMLKKTALNAGEEVPANDFFDLCEKLFPLIKKKIATRKLIKEKATSECGHLKLELLKSFYAYIKETYPAIKNERYILTFDDLLTRLYHALKKEGENGPLTNLIRQKYKLALVDEFQDTDNIQYEIFKHLFECDSSNHGFFMIGDPKQSIYKFRSADIFCYLSAKKDAREIFTLDSNYRSEKKMVDAVNDLFSYKGRDDTFAFPPEPGKAGITYEKVKFGSKKAPLIIKDGKDEPLRFWLVNGYDATFTERNATANVAKEIIRLMDLSVKGDAYFDDNDKTPLKLEDMTVLVNTNKQAALVKDRLSKSKIPAVIQNSVKIFESWEAKEMRMWVQAVAKPIEKNIRPLLISNLLYHNADQIDAVTDQEILEWTEELTLLNKLWQSNGFLTIFLHFISRHKVREQVLKKINGERVITNYLHLSELLHKKELQDGKCIEKTLSYLERMIDDSGTDDEFVQRLESDRNAVRIMTIHKAKGLEFPIVFCPFLWNNAINKAENSQTVFLFNDEEKGQYVQKLDFGGNKEQRKNNLELSRRETIAEHIRLMYVAVTRAGNRCYLPIGQVHDASRSLLSYIFTPLTLEEFAENVPAKKSESLCGTWLSLIIEGVDDFVNKSQSACLETKGELDSTPMFTKKTAEKLPPLKAREFTPRLLKTWGVSSFSDLTENHSYHSEKKERGEGIFALPKGPNFGNAVHKIFENYFRYGKDEFEADRAKYFEAPLKTDAFFRASDDDLRAERFGVAERMIKNILDQPIKTESGELILGNISKIDAKTEFPFSYRINRISASKLKDIFETHGVDDIKEFSEELGTLTFSFRKGYMKGEIDLLFRNNGTYYLLDWKTNHLGPKSENYDYAGIMKSMSEHCYILQYHIYTLALHLFLRQKIKDYDYERDCGGVYYIYTRGVDLNGNGIFYDKPPVGLIKSLEEGLCS